MYQYCMKHVIHAGPWLSQSCGWCMDSSKGQRHWPKVPAALWVPEMVVSTTSVGGCNCPSGRGPPEALYQGKGSSKNVSRKYYKNCELQNWKGYIEKSTRNNYKSCTGMHNNMHIAITVLHEWWVCVGMQRQTLLTLCNQGTLYTCMFYTWQNSLLFLYSIIRLYSYTTQNLSLHS